MGETGVGKTKLLEMLSTLYGKGSSNWHKLQIHAGITDQKIVEFIEEVTKKYQQQENKEEKVCIFFDEINTCNSLGLITEIMCNHTYLGKTINENFVFLGACNPYRIITKKMKASGLVYYNTKEKNKLDNLVYTVNPLPHSLLNFIFDFGSLQDADEKKYIVNTIIDILSRFKATIKNFDQIPQKDIDKIQKEIIESIVICHKFLRDKYDRSAVSLREIRRFGIFFEYFIKYFNKNDYVSLKDSLNMTLYLCYYLRLNDKKYRDELSTALESIFEDFMKVPESEMKSITNKMAIEKDGGIALNRALRENLFTCFICIENLVPLIIVGKPGTGKSLSFQILYNTLKGEYSSNEFFKEKGKLYRYYYQGSGTSTSEGIQEVFDKALKAKKNSEKNNNKIITLVFFDEMGLAERSVNNPLKIIHYLLEKDTEDSVPFLGISNWKLDAAKINRALNLSITDYDQKDLEDTAIAIADALDKDISSRNSNFFKTLAQTYFEYKKFIQDSITENKDFHGNRDFYHLVKSAMRELMERKEELNIDRKKVLTEAGLHALDRNFSGLEESNTRIKKMFKDLYQPDYEVRVEFDKPYLVLDAIEKNMSDTNTRYLMLISEGSDARDIVKYILKTKKRQHIEIIGSKYRSDISSGEYSEEILNKIKYIMETDTVLILKDLDMIYPSLYDVFNQNFTIMGEKKFARIAFEYAKISSEVNNNFHVIVLVNKSQIKNLKLDPPFLNRFEKHIFSFDMILEERDLNIAKKISDYIELISSFNNNKNLKIDIDNMFINCRLHNIEGLIFKIKNEINLTEAKNKKDFDYEEYITQEVFRQIVPTFCQDIIAAMVNSGVKPENYNEMVLDIYNSSNMPNFVSYLKNIKQRKSIIYTFSKITEDIFKEQYLDENANIENEFGKFNKQSTIVEMIESIKSEKGLEFLLKSLNDSDDKNLLILKFTERDLNKISSIHYFINDFEKKNPNLLKKLIILTVHKQRVLKNNKYSRKFDSAELVSFFEDDYYQIFIDNLLGKENLDIFKIIQQNNDLVAEEYIYNPAFIENKIFMVVNYLKYKIIFETKDLNQRNYTTKLTEMILNNEYIQEKIIINLKKQKKSVKNTIKDVFLSDTLEMNDVDFIEVLSTKLSIAFSQCLLNIIYSSLNDNILNPFIINKDIDSLMKNDYFNNIVKNYFEKAPNLNPKPKMDINANEIVVYNNLLIPKSKQNFASLVKYFDGMFGRFLSNEDSLRLKKYKEKKIREKENEYKANLKQYKNNIKTQMNKNTFFKEVIDLNIKDLLINEYLKYFIIKYIEKEKKEIYYEYNSKLFDFLKLLVEIKLNNIENEIDENDIQETIDEFTAIFIFTQGYKKFLHNMLNNYLEIIKYSENFIDIMKAYLNEKKIIYEESSRNPRYTKIVNMCLFNIYESFIRALLIQSQKLLEKDKAKFVEYIQLLSRVEISLNKINSDLYLMSKEIYSLKNIIKIIEAFKDNQVLFDTNYNKIINNLFSQTELFYIKDFDQLYKKVLDLIKIIEDIYQEKNETYRNLLFFIYRLEYKNIYDDEIKIKLLEKFFNNQQLLKNSKIFLAETLKMFKPETIKDKKSKTPLSSYIDKFMNLEDEKFSKVKNILNACNKINLPEFNEILLYFFEGLCQNYFLTILKKYNNKFTQICCEEMLLDISLGYLSKAIKYLYEHKNNNDNNLFKLYAIAYIKSYCHFYVEIHKNNFDKINWSEIDNILYDKDTNNEQVAKMRYYYILRLYYSTFPDFETFINHDFKAKLPVFDFVGEQMKKESITEGYIFNESFITKKNYDNYQILLSDIQNDKYNFDLINNNFDSYYCYLVNKVLSFKLGKDKEQIHQKMKEKYNNTKEGIKLGNEGKILYEYLLNNEMFESEITSNIITEGTLTIKDLEILLYSLRFVFNTKNDENKFYYNLLRPKANEFIKNNYIPGSFQNISEFYKSYKILEQKLPLRIDMGYFLCKDCGFLYEVEPCTFPMIEFECINGHTIGGKDHVCSKKDIRVFYDKGEYEYLKEKWITADSDEWFNSFESIMNLQEFKKKYVDKNIPVTEKGIIKGYEGNTFENLDYVRDMDSITFRLLNFVLYSYLFCSNIVKSLSKEEMKDYLIRGYNPNLFCVIKKNWDILGMALKEKGIENVPIFLNLIFEDLIEKINKLDSVDTLDKLKAFEKDVNDYILGLISKKEDVENMINEYKSINKELNKLSPYSIKEIIKSSFDPSVYDQNNYPDIQYYSLSSLQNYDTFIRTFNSLEENENKYFLINLLIKKEQDMTKDALNIKSIESINNLENLLINIFSYKISRDEAKKQKLKDKLDYIYESYIKMDDQEEQQKSEDDFKKELIEPFFKSWDNIKSKSIQYKCMILKNEKGEIKPLDMNEDNDLSYFLLDKGDNGGGMYLASAYDHLIEWQDKIINIIIEKNKESGILNSYIPQLEKEIPIQNATKSDMIYIDDTTYESLEKLIMDCSMRDIFNNEGKIDYKNYYENTYDYEYIETELAKLVLQGKKKFKHDDIKFIIYKYEEFRGENSSIFIQFNEKYPKKELSEEEKSILKEDLLKENNNSKSFYDISSSIQLIMKQLIIDDYDPNGFIYEIIENLPQYIILNQELKNMLEMQFQQKQNTFRINTLISVFEYFENFCWEEMKKHISPVFQLKLDDKIKQDVIDYFKKNDTNDKKIINKQNFTTALRRLIARYLLSSRQETQINPDLKLRTNIGREEFWNKDIINKDSFMKEIWDICNENITIGNSYTLYETLGGDNILKMELGLNIDVPKPQEPNPPGEEEEEEESEEREEE